MRVRKANRRALFKNGVAQGALMLALASAAVVQPVQPEAMAQVAVNDQVLNPLTGLNETVVQIFTPQIVLTGNQNVILLVEAVGDEFTDPATGLRWRVTKANKNAAGRVTSVDIELTTDTSQTATQGRVADAASGLPGPGGSAGGGTTSFGFTTGAGDINQQTFTSVGSNGGNGRNGGSYTVGIGKWKVTIGFPSRPGGAGAAGGFINEIVGGISIQTVSDNLAGIAAISQGGNGGRGGNQFGNSSASPGGAGGAGGNVNLTSSATITTSGFASHGILAQSRGGRGGDGGSGFLFASGGAGGVPAVQAGQVTVTNWGSITTTGEGAIGILAQSLGGSAGNGGGSFGFVSEGGGGSLGGNGGAVIVNHNGAIQTFWTDAHGILAQSIGGSGGNAGSSFGAVALGASGAAGGQGGSVDVVLGWSSTIRTEGRDARGIFAQSVGGGGGSASTTGGALSLGGSGAGGGAGGRVSVVVGTGSSIFTLREGSDAIFAQSVGGGGGSGSTSYGAASLGGSGGGGGNGGAVSVSNAGGIETRGNQARGIFAQSVGGGGGRGGDSFGGLSLGGAGSTASFGSNVTVNNSGAIITRGIRSSAIQAQSVGGGGGDGGSSGAAFISVGGSGGAGGSSGVVTVNHAGSIATFGEQSHGIFAQSVGGGGGNGGSSVGASAFAGASIGGSGGNGGAGGQVVVGLGGGSVTTQGPRSRGIFAQSVGGGGGNGGWSVQASGGYGFAAGISIGGSGGAGGAGGTVTLTGNGDILTTGVMSEGIFAQSVGGGGGNGGFAISFAGAAAGPGAAAFSLAMGGAGGNGGDGNLVDARSSGTIFTSGNFSTGFVAQSVGGGGGNGGFSVSVTAAGGSAGAGAVSAGVGGSGGSGGHGGTVDGVFDGTIQTVGHDAGGALFQSVGGGGGNGGFNVSGSFAFAKGGAGAGAFGLGGTGGGGGHGGAVAGHVLQAILTSGDRSTGLTVQSVGGGGGNGGFNVSGAMAGSRGNLTAAGTLGLGGSGGNGGNGGSVIASAGPISTTGAMSNGLVAQSLGGGGGSGAFNISGSVAVTLSGPDSGTSLGVSAGLGGSGGSGGHGSWVAATQNGVITTTGPQSVGVTVQSVGGGGGSGAFNFSGGFSGSFTRSVSASLGMGGTGGGGGVSGNVSLTSNAGVGTRGDASNGVIVQTVGGGGGSGSFNVSQSLTLSASGQSGSLGVGVGGGGGNGGSAGSASLFFQTGIADSDNTLLAVTTDGRDANAVTVQSVGGGGGSGAFNISGQVALGLDGAGAIGLGLGGRGGNGGHGGTVNANLNGDVITLGDRSDGILAQSIGGGGGNGGFNISGSVAASKRASGTLAVGVGGSGGGGGHAGNVSGTVTGDIRTSGAQAFGLTYQSIGGGGGHGGFNVSGAVSLDTRGAAPLGNLGSTAIALGIGGSGGNGGHAGAVSLNHNGTITTQGAGAYGALLQSVGGGGGNGGLDVASSVAISAGAAGSARVGIGGFGGGGGHAGAVNGQFDGTVMTAGDNAFGLLMQSVGGGGGNGGINISGGLALSTSPSDLSVSAGFGLGGSGGFGGIGNTVNAVVSGDYQTRGSDANAILVQSVGGGGGHGGLNISGGVSLAQDSAANITGGIGGFGGNGGNAGSVLLVRRGNTFALGSASSGVIAQSIAGGGGNGALNISGGLTVSRGDRAGGLSFGLGGFGGGGGHSGNVTVQVDGHVTALGHAVLAQSVGGGGGDGGFNISGGMTLNRSANASAQSAVIGVGGFGSSGGDAGSVSATLRSATGADLVASATGLGAFALGAQSIGGGGGSGGFNINGGLSTTDALSLAVGGFAGAGGLGRDVTVDAEADLLSRGAFARGLLAQSIGGGGGQGGFNLAGNITYSGSGNGFGFAMGGNGGSGSASGAVTVTHNGNIRVGGYESVGLLAQSVAGGGGSGGFNAQAQLLIGDNSRGLSIALGGGGGSGADAGDISVNSTGNILVNDVAPSGSEDVSGGAGLFAQSVGGGGGNAGINLNAGLVRGGDIAQMVIGGSGGAAGDGGDVTVVRGYTGSPGSRVEDPGVIQTFWDNAEGLVAESIGGGGGHASFNLGLAGATAAAENAQPSSRLFSAAIAIGGNGGATGIGGTVRVDHLGDIRTAGRDSTALVARSVGGGGGHASFNAAANVASGSNALSFALGGDPADGGAGGDVTVAHRGTISTAGGRSYGILAQSIGGGGGNAVIGTDIPYLYSVSTATTISADNQLTFVLGRQGGTGAQGGNIDVNFDGVIVTDGTGSTAIVAESIGGGGGRSTADQFGVQASSGTVDSADEEYVFGASLSLGRRGGSGGQSGDVSVVSHGSIMTTGDGARGVHAFSLAGGGGVGGSALTLAPRATVSVDASIGGVGGSGAVAGNVMVANSAQIVTSGADSDAILARSIGGGGGEAGSAATLFSPLGLKQDGNSSTNFTAAIGGEGGLGGHAGSVRVTNGGLLVTTGRDSDGIRAESIGGGGGAAGDSSLRNVLGRDGDSSVSMNIGGRGGQGGLGGAVSVSNTGQIRTTGDRSSGILARSIGGGGGEGGSVNDRFVQPVMTESNSTTTRVVLNLGGTGGLGGVGGAVEVNNATGASIFTSGARSHGIWAESIGGGGGTGGAVSSFTFLRGEDTTQVNMTIGGRGDSGGLGGAVTVSNDGTIMTSGEAAHGIFARSLGGGGGDGAMSRVVDATRGLSFGSDGSSSRSIAIGGFGGDGGDGGNVTVNNTGSIVTTGQNAHGILAQSIGGGGGNAGLGVTVVLDAGTLVLANSISTLIGAVSSGSGGRAGSVVVNQTGDIVVTGQGSEAFLAESINGGGGQFVGRFGSFVVPLPTAPNTTLDGPLPGKASRLTTADFNFDLGGRDNVNLAGGDATSRTGGEFATGGDLASALVLRSLGGGGGDVFLDMGLAAGGGAADIRFQLGGQTGSRNAGGDLSAAHNGGLRTFGDLAPGGILQSIGGGGGRVRLDLGIDNLASLGVVETGFGAASGTDNSSGDLSASVSGPIVTSGAFAPGFALQSIAGGGGLSSMRISGDATNSTVNLFFGGDAEAGAHAGDIALSTGAGLVTLGDRSIGLLAQSIGGGGGYSQIAGADGLGVTLGGENGTRGDGGDITVANSGLIATAGERSHGVLLQSIGGGGGLVMSDASDVDVTLNSGNGGNGGAISFVQDGSIVTEGDDTYGVILQSLGGGGGWVDGGFAGSAGGAGAGGSIDFAITGDVWATQSNSVALFAQSAGALGGGDITGLLEGFVRGGSGDGRGVYLDGGNDNTLTSNGILSAVSTWAVEATNGNDSIFNNGVVAGNMDLGSGSNSFTNNEGATYIAFSTIDLRDGVAPQEEIRTGGKRPVQDALSVASGQSRTDQPGVDEAVEEGKPSVSVSEHLSPLEQVAGMSPTVPRHATELGASAAAVAPAATFTNAGDFLMGLQATTVPIDLAIGDSFYNLDAVGPRETNIWFGSRVINDVQLDGHFTQTSTGHMVFDVAYGPYEYDVVTLTGDATVDGTGDATFIWLSDAEAIPLFTSASGTATDNGLEITDTLAVDFSISTRAGDVLLNIDTDFGGVAGLNRNERAFGGHMDSNLLVGGAEGTGRLLAWMGNLQDEALYNVLMTELNPEPHVAVLQGLTNTSRSFAADLLNCGSASGVRSSETCTWSRMDAGTADRDRSFERFSTQADTFSVRAGYQLPLNETWNLGAAIGFESVNYHDIDGSRASTNGEGVTVGATVNRDFSDGILFAASLSGGWMHYETARSVRLFETMLAESEPEAGYLDMTLRTGRVFEFDSGFYVTPRADLGFTNLIHDGFAETGALGMGVRSEGDSDWMVTASPALEFGWARSFEDAREFRVNAVLGARLHSDDYVGLPISFVEAPNGAIPAQIETQIDQEIYTFDAGFDFIQSDRMNVSFGYRGEYGETTENHQAGFQLGVRF